MIMRPTSTRDVVLRGVHRRDVAAAASARARGTRSAIAIVFAVNWPPHAPAPGQATSSRSCSSSALIVPRGVRARPPRRRPETVTSLALERPARSSRRRGSARDVRDAPAPSRRPGSSCRRRRGTTTPSNIWPRATSSIESAITSRLTSEAFIPSVPIVMPSRDRDGVELHRRAAGVADACLDLLRRARAG